MHRTSGRSRFSRRVIPVKVPLVPIDATKWVSRAPVRSCRSNSANPSPGCSVTAPSCLSPPHPRAPARHRQHHAPKPTQARPPQPVRQHWFAGTPGQAGKSPGCRWYPARNQAGPSSPAPPVPHPATATSGQAGRFTWVVAWAIACGDPPGPLVMVEPAIPARSADQLPASGRQPDNPGHTTKETTMRPAFLYHLVTPGPPIATGTPTVTQRVRRARLPRHPQQRQAMPPEPITGNARPRPRKAARRPLTGVPTAAYSTSIGSARPKASPIACGASPACCRQHSAPVPATTTHCSGSQTWSKTTTTASSASPAAGEGARRAASSTRRYGSPHTQRPSRSLAGKPSLTATQRHHQH